MSEHYSSKIDEILDITKQVDRVTGSLMASLAWWAASSLVYTRVQLDRIFDTEDAAYSNLADETKQRMSDEMQARLDRTGMFLSWVSSLANDDLLPTGQLIVDRFASRTPDFSAGHNDEDVQAHADLMGLTFEEAKADFEANAEQRRQQHEAMQRVANNQHDKLIQLVDYYIEADLPEHLDIDDQLASRIADRMAAKLENYTFQRRQRAAATIRERRKASLAAEVRLLTEATKLADQLANDAELAIESSRGEEIDHALAS